MLVLIATNELQGASPDDYTWTVEGELVTPLATECASGDRCGCRRGFPGLASSFATTTAMVADRPGVTEADLRDAVFDWLDRGGWVDLLQADIADELQLERDDLDVFAKVEQIVEDIVDDHIDCIQQVCSSFAPGTVVTRYGDFVSARTIPTAA